ncbi:MAG: ATP synthase gamma chain [Isosphaeraceae bacterium]|jgi:F-type H+-transporting ATPase subunit gamma|nr:MAG: ATP synthase gamma chain [Isosphaeraceae bacterium]
MAKARAIVKRRKSVQNIRKITRTMELIASARFRKALQRAVEAEAFTRKIAEIVGDLGGAATEVSHPLLEVREPVRRARLVVITSNRGLAGGYNGNVFRAGARRYQENTTDGIGTLIDVVGKRGVGFMKFRGYPMSNVFLQFDDRPTYEQVNELATEYERQYVAGEIDRLDVAYTRFITAARQEATVTSLLPMRAASLAESGPSLARAKGGGGGSAAAAPQRRGEPASYEFYPDRRSILDELVPISFRVQLFKCFLDAAVSEQIARMVAMKGATENADEMIRSLTLQYNRARQSQITRELAEIIGGSAALE